jgi:hypothetical protein
MAILSRNRVAEGILSISSLGILVATMSALNENVRKEVVNLLTGDAANNLAMASAGVQRTTFTATQTVLDFVHVNTPLVAFSFVAVVLLLLMLRP